MNFKNLKTDVGYWVQSGNNKIPNHVGSWFQEIFDKFLPKDDTKTVIEVGTCPGYNLAALVRSHNYSPFAIDFLPAVNDLPVYFQANGLPSPEVFNEDFIEWKSPLNFDVVMSFGFIEHFENWEEVLQKHWDIVAPGGVLLIGVPIFGCMQMWLRRLSYKDAKLIEVLESHNLRAMNLRSLILNIKNYKGSRLIFSGHIKNMDTWIRADSDFVKPERAYIVKIWHILARIPRKFCLSMRAFSPYAIVVAKKCSV